MNSEPQDAPANPALARAEEAERLAKEATPGPWYEPHICDDSHPCNCAGILSEGYASGIASVTVSNGLPVSRGGNDAPPKKEAAANARLIARARTLLPTLAADLRAALGREKQLREAMMEKITGCQYDLKIARAALEGRE